MSDTAHNLPHLKGSKLIIFGMPDEMGSWFIVKCVKKDCPNQATYWSKNGKKQNRKYDCGDHQ